MGIEGAGSGVAAALGRSPIVGALSVPPSWTAPEPLHSPLSSTLGAHRWSPLLRGGRGRARVPVAAI